ncbi:MAG: cupin [Rhizobiales bacterium]|nr:cupin [Hyphomicrobiales bacterium]
MTPTNVNADFSARAVVHGGIAPWIASPMPGVERKLLDRIGGEVARATSIVRYAPGSHFSPHTHDGGEEFLVLDGVFTDEHGDYPAGSYVRNPPTTRHTPGSAAGCTILVKLWQFDPDDRVSLRLDTATLPLAAHPDAPGVSSRLLYRDEREEVRIEAWEPGARVHRQIEGGLEVFCLAGGFAQGGDGFVPWSWLRLPVGAVLEAEAGPAGCRLWTKEGHLRHVAAPPGA